MTFPTETFPTKTLALPRLNNLRPTLESTALKLMEEAGELAEAIGKLRGMNGEQVETEGHHVYQLVARELLDVAQTAVTMMFVLEEQHGVDIERAMVEHLEKLLAKGYLTVYGGGRVAGMAGVFPGVGALPGADTAGEEGGPTCRGGSQA